MAEIGKSIDRVDGRLKVTGAARYAAEYNQPQMAYAVPVGATIGSGKIVGIDRSAAEKAGGVLFVWTHENAPRLKPIDPTELAAFGGYLIEYLLPLQDARVHYYGQFVAYVVAETCEQARHAASLIEIEYEKSAPAIELEKELPKGFKPKLFFGFMEIQIDEGNTARAVAAAPINIERIYRTAMENHHPMEMHASIAEWEGDKLTVYDATQSLKSRQATIASILGIKPDQVRIISKFIGGAFGCKGGWTYSMFAALAAKEIKRPVKVVLSRQMMQTNVGRRGATVQSVTLAGEREGKLSAIRHLTGTYTNLIKDAPVISPAEYFEPGGIQTKVLYGAPSREIKHTVARLNIGSPNPMRAPGEAAGSFALESAMDEMAFELKIDPVEFRLINYAEVDPLEKLPWSSNFLKDCYRLGAKKFGWTRRKSEPRSMRRGKYLVGHGMATATYRGNRLEAAARVRMGSDGSVLVSAAAEDIGTGTYTIMTQTASDALGVTIGKIKIEIGDSNLPPGPGSAGSQLTASVNPAVLAACEKLREELLAFAVADKKSKLFGRNPAEISFADAAFFVAGDASKTDSYADIMRRAGKTKMETCVSAKPFEEKPKQADPNPDANEDKKSGGQIGGAPCSPAAPNSDTDNDKKKYAFHSFGAQFVEVWVDEDLGTIRVKRVTSVHDVGRIMNEKTARSQVIGGVIFGIGHALMEETQFDKRFGNPVQRTLADYHVPVQMDVPEIDVHFINQPDLHMSSIGARGVGEIGGVGIAAAIANAVFNATGKRIRALPLTLDKLL